MLDVHTDIWSGSALCEQIILSHIKHSHRFKDRNWCFGCIKKLFILPRRRGEDQAIIYWRKWACVAAEPLKSCNLLTNDCCRNCLGETCFIRILPTQAYFKLN